MAPTRYRQALRRLGLTDPAGKPLDEVREIRDDISARIAELVEEPDAG